ncbi:MAG: hypothetical protein AAFZ15_22040 [Bacteroidota bacterium]
MNPILKYLYLGCLLFAIVNPVYCQGDVIMVKGVVVEVSEGKKKPVPNIKVKVFGESEDVTKTDGSFTLFFPPEKEYISISLEGCPHPIVSPYAARVNIPPDEFLEIKVCAKENKKLREKINTLNENIRKLERQRKLNKRQLAAMHQTLLDTILYFELRINNLENELTGKEVALNKKNEKIIALQNEVASLEKQLSIALEEKYLRQKDVFDQVSTELNQYLDQVKNLRDDLRPIQVKSYFVNPGAREQLYTTINEYNAARKKIINHTDKNIADVSNYWEKFELADELEETYQFLLTEVHQEGVYPMEFAVNDNLKKSLTRQLSSSKAKKAATAGAEAAIPTLNPMIAVLEEKIADIIFKLRTNL